MTDDILHTIQNSDELHRLATELLTAQAREYEQRLHNLNTVNSTLEQRIHDLHAAMQAEKTAYEQRIRELEEALKLAQQWRFGRKSERLPVSQKPLADEDAASDEADITRQLRDQLPPEEKTGKKPVPAHLPQEETVLAPETGPGDGHPCPGCGAAMLAGWSGTLVVDGDAGYSALFRGGQEGESPVASGIREAGCLAHVRRKFMELYRMNGSPGAREALEQIRALYILERTIWSRSAEQKRRWRRRYARPRMAELLTLLHTARLNGLEPVVWRRDVLEKLPSWPTSRLDELLPYRRQTD